MSEKSLNSDPDVIEGYTKLKKLGSGQCGDVFLVLDNKNGKKYAMKNISTKNVLQENVIVSDSHEVKEIDIMLKLHNPHTIHIHDLILDPIKEKMLLILHLCNKGSL